MNFTNLFTVIGGALLTLVPQVVAVIPPPYAQLAGALISAAGMVYHLYRPVPSAPVSPAPAAPVAK